MIAIVKVVIRARQHLAAIEPKPKGLILELMHFPAELIDVKGFKSPPKNRWEKPNCAWLSNSSKA